jgi:hypothetical protein
MCPHAGRHAAIANREVGRREAGRARARARARARRNHPPSDEEMGDETTEEA